MLSTWCAELPSKSPDSFKCRSTPFSSINILKFDAMSRFSPYQKILSLSEKATPVPETHGRRNRFNGLNIKGLFLWEGEDLDEFLW
jgi:hypothetical protein